MWIPLPPDLVADIGTLKPVGGMCFAAESDHPPSIADYYRQKLRHARAAERPQSRESRPASC